MDRMSEAWCGLDVHKKVVVACLATPLADGTVGKVVRSFATPTAGLLELADWLAAGNCREVAMESTGSYWKPIFNILESRFAVIVVSGYQIKQLRGRKTDVRDAELIADLLRQGALRPSFVPKRAERELRELVRYRASLIAEHSAETNRIQKVLEGANIKLASVVSNILGVSGREILKRLAAGETDANLMADLARGKLRQKRDALAESLKGEMGPHQVFLLQEQLGHLADLEARIERASEEVERRLRPFQETLKHLETIPGVARRAAEIIVSEVGLDMTRFPTAGHLASWTGLCPGMRESAGKNRSGRTPHGPVSLKSTLVQAAHASARTDTFIGARYRRLRARLGPQKAAVAVAHSLIVVIYHLLRHGADYRDYAPTGTQQEREVRRHTRRLERLGYKVTVEHVA